MDKDPNEAVISSVYKHELWGKVTDVMLECTQYTNNGTLAVMLNSKPDFDDDCQEGELGFVEPYSTMTVNLPASTELDINEQFVDTNNLPGIGEWLESNGIAKPTGKSCRSGFCIYPVYAFNLPERVIRETSEYRDDCLASSMVQAVESSPLVPAETNDRGSLYNLPDKTRIVVYNGTCPASLGVKPDIFLLAKQSGKGETMIRFRNLPAWARSQVSESIRSALNPSSRLKL